jgi:hypothetical protein
MFDIQQLAFFQIRFLTPTNILINNSFLIIWIKTNDKI